jgi:hypothetical protein
MKERVTLKKSLLLRLGLFAGFRIFLWKGEEIISRIVFAPASNRHVRRARSVKDSFPASSWALIGKKPCCMVLDGDRLEIHLLSDIAYN